jgi:hypothetical protein
MNSASEKEQYTKSLNALGIRRDRDPFPFDPPKVVDYWADNKGVLQKIVQAQIDSVMFASSFMYILYGPVGGGKTFAVKYLANPETQKLILAGLKKPEFKSLSIRVRAIVPIRTGQLTFSLHKDIVKKCLSAIFKSNELITILKKTKQIGEGNVKAAFRDLRNSVRLTLEGKVNIANLENSEGYKFLTQTKSRLGKLQDVNELVESIEVLVRVLSEKYGRIIISIDELENLRRATGTEMILCSDFLRKMHEMIEHDLTVFLIFTLESFEEVSRLLQTAFVSRVKERIEFPFVRDRSDVKEYITECISQRSKINPYEVIEEEVIDAISDSLITSFRGRLSFRDINREMHKIFTSTYIFANQPRRYKIDNTLYKRAIKGITAEEVVKQITDKLAKKGDVK